MATARALWPLTGGRVTLPAARQGPGAPRLPMPRRPSAGLPSGCTTTSSSAPSAVPTIAPLTSPAGSPPRSLRARCTVDKQAPSPPSSPGPPEPRHSLTELGGLGEVEPQLARPDLGGVRRLPDLGPRIAQALAEALHQQFVTHLPKAPAQFVSGLLRPDGGRRAGVHRPSVEPLFQGHQAHPGRAVAREDRALDRGRPPPPGQQREVDVHHGHGREHVRLDEPPVGDHHAQLGATTDHCRRRVSHRQAESFGRSFYGARARGPAPSSTGVGSLVTTTGTSWPAPRRARKVPAATSGVPRKASFTAAPSVLPQP